MATQKAERAGGVAERRFSFHQNCQVPMANTSWLAFDSQKASLVAEYQSVSNQPPQSIV